MEADPELVAIRAKLLAQMGALATNALDHPVDVTDAEFPAFVRDHPAVVVDVWAEWCGPCKMLEPIVDSLAKEMAGRVTFAKVDADTNPAIMGAFGIQGIPTLLVFQDGRLVDRVTGALPKAALAARLERTVARR